MLSFIALQANNTKVSKVRRYTWSQLTWLQRTFADLQRVPHHQVSLLLQEALPLSLLTTHLTLALRLGLLLLLRQVYHLPQHNENSDRFKQNIQ